MLGPLGPSAMSTKDAYMYNIFLNKYMNIKTYIHAHETNRHRVGKFGNCAGPIRPIYNEFTIMYTCLNTKHKAQTIYEYRNSESKIQPKSNRSNNRSMPIKSICNSHMWLQ